MTEANSKQSECAEKSPRHEDATHLAALNSLYHLAYEREGAARFLLPGRLRPMDPQKAVAALRNASQDVRKLALAKLVAAGGLEEEHGLHAVTQTLLNTFSGKDEPGFTPRALTENIHKVLRARFEIGMPPGQSVVRFVRDSRGYRSAAHEVILGTPGMFAATAPSVTAPPGCQQTPTHTDVDFDVNTLVSSATVSIEVEREDFNGLARVMDPRSWHTLGPDYFPYSYQVQNDPLGPVQWEDNRPKEWATDPQPLGSTWKGLLFEQFEWTWNEVTSSRFRNLLGISYTVTPAEKKIHLHYWLSRCIDSEVGRHWQPGGIDVDSGDATVEPNEEKSGAWLTVTASKNLRFTDRTSGSGGLGEPFDLGLALNYMAPALLGIFLDRSVRLAVCAKLP